MSKVPNITSLQYLCNISGKTSARHAQVTQNNKFAIYLQYLKKEVSDEVDFLDADKHENFLQIDTMIFDGDGQAFRKSQNSNFAMSSQVSLQTYQCT